MARILLGVTGSIAAYKAVDVARSLIREGHTVDVVLTGAARRFVGELTFASLVNGSVYVEGSDSGNPYAHLELAKSDLILVCPATASTINKVAAGIADNLLTTVLIATQSPVVLCPAMNERMYLNEKVQSSLSELENRGWYIVRPEAGKLACGDEGVGRLAAAEDIVAFTLEALKQLSLSGRRVLITSGPTREYLDDVRFISNSSSGRMGYYLALEAQRAGAEVVFITGPAQFSSPAGAKVIKVTGAVEMLEACLKEADRCDIIIMSAAVADFMPEQKLPGKLRRSQSERLELRLVRTPDILGELAQRKRKEQVLVGFALEEGDFRSGAEKKLHEKDLDMVVGNPLSAQGESLTSIYLYSREGKSFLYNNIDKRIAARKIIEFISNYLLKESG